MSNKWIIKTNQNHKKFLINHLCKEIDNIKEHSMFDMPSELKEKINKYLLSLLADGHIDNYNVRGYQSLMNGYRICFSIRSDKIGEEWISFNYSLKMPKIIMKEV